MSKPNGTPCTYLSMDYLNLINFGPLLQFQNLRMRDWNVQTNVMYIGENTIPAIQAVLREESWKYPTELVTLRGTRG